MAVRSILHIFEAAVVRYLDRYPSTKPYCSVQARAYTDARHHGRASVMNTYVKLFICSILVVTPKADGLWILI